MDVLVSYFHDYPDLFFSVINQHLESRPRGVTRLSRPLKSLAAPASWHDPIPLQCGWCLFEMYSKEDIMNAPRTAIKKMLAS